MPIENIEDAKIYINRIEAGCLKLATIAVEAGLHRNASIFLALGAAFTKGPEYVEDWETMTKMWMDKVQSDFLRKEE